MYVRLSDEKWKRCSKALNQQGCRELVNSELAQPS